MSVPVHLTRKIRFGNNRHIAEPFGAHTKVCCCDFTGILVFLLCRESKQFQAYIINEACLDNAGNTLINNICNSIQVPPKKWEAFIHRPSGMNYGVDPTAIKQGIDKFLLRGANISTYNPTMKTEFSFLL